MDFEPACPPNIVLCDNVIVEQGTQKLTLVGCFHAFNGSLNWQSSGNTA
jgi:hypothetical protein